MKQYLEPLDWRYSAAIVGLYEFLEAMDQTHTTGWELHEDKLEYDDDFLTLKNYLKFVEIWFRDDLVIFKILELLDEPNPTDAQIKFVNDLLKSKTVLKKLKWDGTNADAIRDYIQMNRQDIVKSIYCNGNKMYRLYCNQSALGKPDSNKFSRVVGYGDDFGKKGKASCYNFNTKAYEDGDLKIFDYIPFAFAGYLRMFFINDNVDLRELVKTNRRMRNYIRDAKKEADDAGKSISMYQLLLEMLCKSSQYLAQDIEIIMRDSFAGDYFETLYIRPASLRLLSEIGEKNQEHPFEWCRRYIKALDLDMAKEISDMIINQRFRYDLLNLLMKVREQKDAPRYLGSLIHNIIRLHILMRGEQKVKTTVKQAIACGKYARKRLDDNKARSYRQKLATALTMNDKEQVFNVLMNLSNYVDMSFSFLYTLADDYENNKDAVYAFQNALADTYVAAGTDVNHTDENKEEQKNE